jgi:hypothetical protein
VTIKTHVSLVKRFPEPANKKKKESSFQNDLFMLSFIERAKQEYYSYIYIYIFFLYIALIHFDLVFMKARQLESSYNRE